MNICENFSDSIIDNDQHMNSTHIWDFLNENMQKKSIKNAN